jgi:hypothetical protein
MYNMPVHVFQTGDTYLAVSNEAQGVGDLLETLASKGKQRKLGSISEGDSAGTKRPGHRRIVRRPSGRSPEHQRRRRATRRTRGCDDQRDLH